MKSIKQDDPYVDSNDPLVMRLSALDIPVPGTLVPRTLAAHRQGHPHIRRRPRTLLMSLATLVALIAVNLGGSYLSPNYANALAAAPGVGALTGPILQQAGLASVGARALDVRATASGYTVRLFGAYADSVRTTVFIQILGPNGQEAPDGTAPTFDSTLTDQFGRTYHMANGFGMPVIHFDPLGGPAATLGARLTLHIGSIDVNPAPPATSTSGASTRMAAQPGTVVHGAWDLPFTVTSSAGKDLPVPSAVQLRGTTYTFTTVRSTESLLEVRWTITGATVGHVRTLAEAIRARARKHQMVSSTMSAQQKANYDATSTYALLDASGRTIDPIYGYGRGVLRDGQDVAMEMDAWYPIAGHGEYRFRVSDLAGPGDLRTITVP